ncbi:hypothetical protein GF327_03460 [Candidatus Woesearchaeota archaeon]|nr:hypothetical protein [Candidatus Woesearchaeota archaeon]
MGLLDKLTKKKGKTLKFSDEKNNKSPPKLPTPPPLHKSDNIFQKSSKKPGSPQKTPPNKQDFFQFSKPHNMQVSGKKPKLPSPPGFSKKDQSITHPQKKPGAQKIQKSPMNNFKDLSPPLHSFQKPTQKKKQLPQKSGPSLSQVKNQKRQSKQQNQFQSVKMSSVNQKLPSMPKHHDSGLTKKKIQKKVPKKLPKFPQKQRRYVKKKIVKKNHPANKPDFNVPKPPPTLRSEISPLELERLEEKYLHKRPRLADMEEPYSYDRHKKLRKPLFIRTDDFRQVLDYFIDIKDLLNESEEIVYRTENLKKNMDFEYKSFKDSIEDMQRKLIYIDKTLFEEG